MTTAAKIFSGTLLALTLSLFPAPASQAHEYVDYSNLKVGQIAQSMRIDLNNDGRDEVICLKIFKKDQRGSYAKLLE